MNTQLVSTIDIHYQENFRPDSSELTTFFKEVFMEIADTENFSDDQNQNLHEWFSIDEMIKYLDYGKLIEARLQDKTLVGAIFIAQQNPLSWPDGNKMEIFILGVDKNHRGKDIAKKLVSLAEDFAAQAGAKKVLVNTHSAMTSVHAVYRSLGYKDIGTLQSYYDNGDAHFFCKDVTV